jgi:hypothetical protein
MVVTSHVATIIRQQQCRILHIAAIGPGVRRAKRQDAERADLRPIVVFNPVRRSRRPGGALIRPWSEWRAQSLAEAAQAVAAFMMVEAPCPGQV